MTGDSARDGALSPHFMLHEFSTHNGILPPPGAVASLRRLCVEVLEPMRVQFGVCHVISGYRTPEHNRAVGGAKDSRHVYSKHLDSPAADIRFARGTPEQWGALAQRLSQRRWGVGVYKGHVHVDQRRTMARW